MNHVNLPGFSAEATLRRVHAPRKNRSYPPPAPASSLTNQVQPAQSYGGSYDVYGRCINRCLEFGGGYFGCALFCLRG
ncbi:MAG: hypothetical protein DCC55_24085 [Chloroflexi bacterium]|nr:MAG: hypothetical protein DCC55_24085 [Chloroflexota bacterium]